MVFSIRTIVKFSAPALIIGLIFISLPAKAQEQMKNALQEASEKVAELGEIRENAELSAEDRAVGEARIIKETLSKIFELTILEDANLEKNLNTIIEITDEEKEIKDRLLEALEENKKVYLLIEERLAAAISLEEIKQLAVDFKNWRQLAYNPRVENVVSFVFIFRQQENLEAAKERLTRIEEDLFNLEEVEILKREEVAEILQKATEHLETAEKINGEAREKMVKMLSRKLFPQTGWFSFRYLFLGAITPTDIKQLVGESFYNIQSAYQIFIEIGNLAKAKIGL